MKDLKRFYFYHLLVINFSIISVNFRIISTKFQKKKTNDHFSIHLKNWCCLYTNFRSILLFKIFQQTIQKLSVCRILLLIFLGKSYKYLMIILYNLTNFKVVSNIFSSYNRLVFVFWIFPWFRFSKNLVSWPI